MTFVLSPAEKLKNLIGILRGMQSVLVAYSGGADSTFLLKAVTLSGIKALAVTASSPVTPGWEIEDARGMAKELGIEHAVVETMEFQKENFLKNPPDRCFYCKDVRFGTLRRMARKASLKFVVDGSNISDRGDFRPGMKAAEKHRVKSPLIESGFTKEEIRSISRELGLSTWDKPSSACLATRFPYGTRLTAEAVERVSRAEDFLRAMGFAEFRVRDHGALARIEVPPDKLRNVLGERESIVRRLKELGYLSVSLDLEGFRSGGMNRGIRPRPLPPGGKPKRCNV